MAQRAARDLCPRSAFGLIVLAGSAGALAAYRAILANVTPDCPVALVIAHHMRRPREPTLVELLAPHTRTTVAWADEGTLPRPATVYVVPPMTDATLAEDGRFRLQPATWPFATADVLLTSLAERLGPRGLAVVLTGAGADGARGAMALRAAGGTVIVQNHATAPQFGMPRAAIDRRAADFVFPLAAIATALPILAVPPRAAVLLNRGSLDGEWQDPTT